MLFGFFTLYLGIKVILRDTGDEFIFKGDTSKIRRDDLTCRSVPLLSSVRLRTMG
jgi:hypothetical protein